MTKRLHGNQGFSVLSAVVSLAVIATALTFFLQSRAQYTSSREEIMRNSLFREVRSALTSKIAHNTQLFFAKGCVSRFAGPVTSMNQPVSPRYNDMFTSALKMVGDTMKRTPAYANRAPSANAVAYRVQETTLNDLMVISSFGGSTGLGRPARFSQSVPNAESAELVAALTRCDASGTNILPGDTSFYGCYEIVARQEMAFDLSGYSILKAENGLLEYRLEFKDLTSLAPVTCQSMATNTRAGVVAKMKLYWGSNKNVRSISDVFVFSR